MNILLALFFTAYIVGAGFLAHDYWRTSYARESVQMRWATAGIILFWPAFMLVGIMLEVTERRNGKL